jgi:hypothetical protein
MDETLLLTLCNWSLPGAKRAQPPIGAGADSLLRSAQPVHLWVFCASREARAAGRRARSLMPPKARASVKWQIP